MTVKIDPGAQVSKIPLSRYHKLFPNKINDSRFPKPNALSPIAHTWIPHGGLPKPFLGHFVPEVKHAHEPRSYLTGFYVFEDTTSPQIVLSYAPLERLGIIPFKVPNLAATSQVDDLTIPTSPTPSGMRKIAKCVTFCDPLVDTTRLHSSAHSPTSHGGMRKTTSLKVNFGNTSVIQGAKCKIPPLLLSSPF